MHTSCNEFTILSIIKEEVYWIASSMLGFQDFKQINFEWFSFVIYRKFSNSILISHWTNIYLFKRLNVGQSNVDCYNMLYCLFFHRTYNQAVNLYQRWWNLQRHYCHLAEGQRYRDVWVPVTPVAGVLWLEILPTF